MIIGTSPECDYVIFGDPYVSHKHCQITRDRRGNMFVTDLGSTNGTYLNDHRIGYNAVLIFPEDKLRVGHTTMKIPEL